MAAEGGKGQLRNEDCALLLAELHRHLWPFKFKLI